MPGDPQAPTPGTEDTSEYPILQDDDRSYNDVQPDASTVPLWWKIGWECDGYINHINTCIQLFGRNPNDGYVHSVQGYLWIGSGGGPITGHWNITKAGVLIHASTNRTYSGYGAHYGPVYLQDKMYSSGPQWCAEFTGGGGFPCLTNV